VTTQEMLTAALQEQAHQCEADLARARQALRHAEGLADRAWTRLEQASSHALNGD